MKASDLSIGTRLVAAFLLISLLTLVTGVLCLRTMALLHDISTQIYDHPLTVGYAMRDLRTLADRIATMTENADKALTAGQLEAQDNRIGDMQTTALQKIALVQERYLGPQDDILEARDTFLAMGRLQDEKFGMLRDQRWFTAPAAKAAWLEQWRRATEDMAMQTQIVVGYAERRAKLFREQVAEEYASARTRLELSLAVILALSLGLGAAITLGITRPLARIMASVKAIAQGDFRQPLEERRGDEIGRLAEAFRDMQASLKDKAEVAGAVASGDLERDPRLAGPDDMLGKALAGMTGALRQAAAQSRHRDWLNSGLTQLSARLGRLGGLHDQQALGDRAMEDLVTYLGAQAGALFLIDEDSVLRLHGGYALPGSRPEVFRLGEGMVGQAAREGRTIVTQVPEGYLDIASALGRSAPASVVVVPLDWEGESLGAMELAALQPFSPEQLEFLAAAVEIVAPLLSATRYRARLEALLDETRRQAKALQEQQEALRVANEELEEKNYALRASEEELRQQQEEQQALNEELEEKNSHLENQERLLEERNQALMTARTDLERRAREMEQASRYKSEFLANMSHELRTPLNSLLILSRGLADNPGGNLDAGQVESARIIQQSGNDLLTLINDLLDLARIEAGRLDIKPVRTQLAAVVANLRRSFGPMATEKGLELRMELAPELPRDIRTDPLRLEQILRNLLSNAVKFTASGGISLRVFRPDPDTAFRRPGLEAEGVVAFAVVDTGIGIPPDKQQLIFEAFQQGDGSIARKFGGTGLGLSISRELCRRLGGEIHVQSESGTGATFTLYLPEQGPGAGSVTDQEPDATGRHGQGTAEGPAGRPWLPPVSRSAALPLAGRPLEPLPSLREAGELALPVPASQVADDRDALGPDDRAVLVIEDDRTFAAMLVGFCRGKGFKALTAGSGEEGLNMVRQRPPTAILLDLKLPGMDGWEVLRRLKADPEVRHIPVHVVSAMEGSLDILRHGAMGFLAKPATPEQIEGALATIEAHLSKTIKDLLIVEDNPALRASIAELIVDGSVRAMQVSTGAEALEALRSRSFDCMILDLGLPDMNGFVLLERLEAEAGPATPPVIVYTGRDLTREEEQRLRRYSESIIVKGARSEERLLDEATIFLHRVVGDMPERKRNMLLALRDRDAALEGKNVLLVDDDMRNLFALSRALEARGLTVHKAENGQKALELLESGQAVDLVLLDVMMPVLDGYETLRRMRAEPRLARLPVIILTAKAMKEDREMAMAAGANDYLAKPVDLDKLFSLLKVWLAR